MLYEAITGKVPFQKPNYNALMHAIINEDPTPSVDCGAGDKALWQIIEKGLKKEREARHQSVTEVGEALALWLYEHGVKEDLSGNSVRAVWLDAAPSTSDMRTLRPAGDSSGKMPTGASKSPTMPAPASSTETVLTLPPRAPAAGGRALYVGLAAFALVLGALGAWAAVALNKPAPPPPAVVPAAAALPASPPQPVVAAPPAAAAEPAPSAPASKPVSAAPSKSKARVPSVRKKGHDFGF
jgi:serine/threonine-protein kinase